VNAVEEIYTTWVRFTPKHDIPLAVWSGIYLHKLILDLLEKDGVVFEHNAPKPFMISPILKSNGYVDRGVLAKGEVYAFKVTTIGREVYKSLIEALYESDEAPIAPISVESRAVKLEAPPAGSGNEKGFLVELKLKFYPTVFKFRGHIVPYPSPIRLLLSVARDMYVISKMDLRSALRGIMSNVELVSYNTKLCKLYIGKDAAGRERYVQALQGVATYIFFALRRRWLPIIEMLLEVAMCCGVGKNRSIGLGHVEILKYNVTKI